MEDYEKPGGRKGTEWLRYTFQNQGENMKYLNC